MAITQPCVLAIFDDRSVALVRRIFPKNVQKTALFQATQLFLLTFVCDSLNAAFRGWRLSFKRGLKFLRESRVMKKFAVIAAAAGMFALAACGEKPAEEAAPDAVATEAVVDDAAAGAEAAAAGAEAAAAGAEAAAGAAAITDAAVPAADVAAAAAAAEEAKK